MGRKIGDTPVKLYVSQSFQFFTGAASAGDARGEIKLGKLHGDQLSMNVVVTKGATEKTMTFDGKVSGTSIAGNFTSDGIVTQTTLHCAATP